MIRVRRLSVWRLKRLTAIGLPIKIPEMLIERLKPYGAHFIKVAAPTAGNSKSGKNAIERGFPNRPYEANDASLQKHLAEGGNYGVLAGEGIVIVETDNKETTLAMQGINTFTVQSGGGGWRRHFYILSNAAENGTINDPETRKNVGNIQVERKFVVGPNCRHYTGNVYKIVSDAPISYVSKQRLDKIFGDALTWAHQRRKESETEAEHEQTEGAVIPLKDLIDLSKLEPTSSGEYQGSHPIHGSLTGKNFCVNPTKNVWHCFRCNSGGGGLAWIAVKHGLIKCCEAQKGALRGKRFFEAMEYAKVEGFDVSLPDEELNPDVARFYKKQNGKRKFVPARLAVELMKENRYVTRASDKMIFRYNPDRGIYEMNADVHIGKQIVKKLGEYYSINRHKETEAYLKIKTTEELPSLPEGLIAVQNGILNVFTRELKPFSPDYFVINALPWKYDKDAECLRYLKFMSEVVPAPEDIKGLQEFLGYCFYPDCRYEKALLLIGVGSNGKSTMLKTWMTFLGKENVSPIPLQIIVIDRFALAELFGKLANIYADIPSVALKDTGIFKMLVSGERMSAQEKYKGRFSFDNLAKLMFSANEVPETPDDTDAYFRRWLMVTYPNQFADDDPKTDKHLLDKLITPEEMSGILNWALDGLERLTKQNRFTISKTNEETREQYTLLSNPEKAFAETHLKATPEAVTPKDTVYNAYIRFCKRRNLPTVSKRTFSMRLPQYIACTDDRTTVGGKTVRVWRNITLSEEVEEIEPTW